MQLILVQSEIEQALKDYVNKTMKLADGVSIEIELQATRGAEGFKATIDIRVPEGRTFVPTPMIGAMVTESIPQPRPSFVATRSPELVSEVVVQTPTEPAQIVDQESSQDTEASSVADQAVDSTSVSEQAPPTNTRSLFKGLGKPKNN